MPSCSSSYRFVREPLFIEYKEEVLERNHWILHESSLVLYVAHAGHVPHATYNIECSERKFT